MPLSMAFQYDTSGEAPVDLSSLLIRICFASTSGSGRAGALPLPLLFAVRGEKATVPVESHTSSYFRWREARERDLADRATSPDIRDIYLSLAEWYRCLAENAEAMEGGDGDRADWLHEPTP